jgi:Raf kinase inhibitor-like YbhB/YbcL family protein
VIQKRVWAALAPAGAALLLVAVGTRAVLRRPSNEPFFSNASLAAHSMAISSGSFPNGGYIPKQFTCDGADISPELSWTNPPPGAQSLALIAEDPDAPVGTWTHWVIFDLPPSTRSLPEGVGKTMDQLPDGGRQGANDFGKIGYGGPCPPPGKPHRYFFKLYAVDRKLDLKPSSTRARFDEAIKNHVLDEADWMGRYRR